MKNRLLLPVLVMFILFAAGCNKSNNNGLLIKPRYDQAQYRAEIGNLFYETKKEIGINTSFGIFIYNLDNEKLTTAFAVDEDKAFGKGYLAEARLSRDEKSIVLLGYSHDSVINDYYYRYDLKSGNLYKIVQDVSKIDFYPMPDQDREAFSTSNWTAQDLAYYSPDSENPIYPFKDVE